MSCIARKYSSKEGRKRAINSWYCQLLVQCDAKDSFYEDRWDELLLEYEDDIMDDAIFDKFFTEFQKLLQNPGQHY